MFNVFQCPPVVSPITVFAFATAALHLGHYNYNSPFHFISYLWVALRITDNGWVLFHIEQINRNITLMKQIYTWLINWLVVEHIGHGISRLEKDQISAKPFQFFTCSKTLSIDICTSMESVYEASSRFNCRNEVGVKLKAFCLWLYK